MERKKLKVICVVIAMIIAMLLMSKGVKAANATISASSTNVQTGTTVTIKANITEAASWELDFSESGGTVTKSADRIGVSDTGENTNTTVTLGTFVAETAGTYTLTLSGYVIDGTLANDNPTKATVKVTGTTTITVTAPATQEPTQAPTQEPTQAPTQAPTQEPTTAPTQEPNYEEVNETVYTTTDVNLRKAPVNGDVIKTLSKGEELKRIGKGDNGWSKVTYNGQTAYISSSYITTTKPADDPTQNPTTAPSDDPNDTRSKDSSLESLSIKNVELSPAFNSLFTTYTANVTADVNELSITAKTTDKKASYEIVGNSDLKMGENLVKVIVTAENETTTEYNITVIKGRELIPLNAIVVNGIKENGQRVGLSIGSPVINDTTVTYQVNIKEKLKSIEILCNLDKEKYEINGAGVIDLKPGKSEQSVTVKQIVEEGETSETITYKFKISNIEETVVENKTENKINFKIIAIVVVATLVVIALVIIVIHFKNKKNIEYGEPDYSFLRNESGELDEKKDKKVEEKVMADATNSEPEDINTERKKGGKHF